MKTAQSFRSRCVGCQGVTFSAVDPCPSCGRVPTRLSKVVMIVGLLAVGVFGLISLFPDADAPLKLGDPPVFTQRPADGEPAFTRRELADASARSMRWYLARSDAEKSELLRRLVAEQDWDGHMGEDGQLPDADAMQRLMSCIHDKVERYADQDVGPWRRIARGCLIQLQKSSTSFGHATARPDPNVPKGMQP